MTEQIDDIDGKIAGADFAPILEWLRTNIHIHGAKYEPQELVKKVTGSKITPEPFIKYLKKKFGAIYNL